MQNKVKYNKIKSNMTVHVMGLGLIMTEVS
nr:MAG TPA: hypothetical protein [Caudoviricetes sp.]